MDIQSVGTVRKTDSQCWIELETRLRAGLKGIQPGSRIDVLYWMHLLEPEKRFLLEVHPRGDLNQPLSGVFGLRSPMRPNPMGVSEACVLDVEENCIRISDIDALNGSPVIDIKASRSGKALQEVIDSWGKIHDVIMRGMEAELSEKRLRDLFANKMRALGRMSAQKQVGDAAGVGRRIMAFEKHWCIRGRVQRDTPQCFTREVTSCPWSYFSPLACKILGWYMAGFCEGLNPGCTYHLLKLIPEGAQTCVWEIRMKAQPSAARCAPARS